MKMKLSKSGDAYFYLENLDENSLDKSEIKFDDDNGEDYYFFENNFKKLKVNKHCSLFPTEDQIKKMGLKEGKNEICYAIETFWGGIQTIKSNIYYWTYRVKMILWDIDGTITKSDALGVILPRLGFK